MKKYVCIIIALLMMISAIPTAYAEDTGDNVPMGVASSNPFFSDCFYITGYETRATNFTISPVLTISSPSANKVSARARASASTTVDKIGFTSLQIQRWNGSAWVNAVSWTNKYKTNTSSFSFTGSTSSATSGAYYRAVCTFYAEKNGETETVTVTTSYIQCL